MILVLAISAHTILAPGSKATKRRGTLTFPTRNTAVLHGVNRDFLGDINLRIVKHNQRRLVYQE